MTHDNQFGRCPQNLAWSRFCLNSVFAVPWSPSVRSLCWCGPVLNLAAFSTSPSIKPLSGQESAGLAASHTVFLTQAVPAGPTSRSQFPAFIETSMKMISCELRCRDEVRHACSECCAIYCVRPLDSIMKWFNLSSTFMSVLGTSFLALFTVIFCPHFGFIGRCWSFIWSGA